MVWRTALLLIFINLACGVSASEVYRYKDAQGRWRFTDKKPADQHETLNFKKKSDPLTPHLITRPHKTQTLVYAANPWPAPVSFWLRDGDEEILRATVLPESELQLKLGTLPVIWQPQYQYRFMLGDPAAEFDGEALRAPVANTGKYRISQGFNGPFTHNNSANAYALDIAMNVGDGIYAARSGTVVTVKDDYHMGGANDYFLDKANLIRIMHDDGSFAIYAHILLGSAMVAQGDRVEAGQQLARCGSSGYSTGPHLHFVVQVQRAGAWQSVPFKIVQSGAPVTPAAGQWIRAE